MSSLKPYPYNKTAQDPRLKWVERVSFLLDEQFRIPGTSFRFGLDPVMNLVPFIGDLPGFLLSAALVLTMAKNGASSKLVVLMAINIVLDATVGAIPVIGQIFDFFYKANTRNMRLLREHYLEGKHSGSGKNTLLLAILILAGLLVLVIWLVIKLFQAIGGWF
ncbi:DUF4112 domain-containing protein [Hufsiella ginkgonis]|uniref:DUF4112 domain-containing protein n=1 Tax=Hufsiella ginkgonis TaxID=2695274 RepID=A0A7K1XTU7_9SPHI|nr:DUF4112 domain-containing protein [Hufsiella ginkgonis]MXV14370.1 DUF4112 domain-containing protein [Hufsiella ginkgonis]